MRALDPHQPSKFYGPIVLGSWVPIGMFCLKTIKLLKELSLDFYEMITHSFSYKHLNPVVKSLFEYRLLKTIPQVVLWLTYKPT